MHHADRAALRPVRAATVIALATVALLAGAVLPGEAHSKALGSQLGSEGGSLQLFKDSGDAMQPMLVSDVSNVTVVNGSPSAGAGARTQYVVGFTTSATGGLSAGANSRISVTFPAGTALGTFTNAQVFDITSNRSVGNCGAAVGQLIQCQLFTNEVIAAGDQVRITFNAITNPATPGPYTLDVSTTSDTTPVSSPAYNVVAANLLTGVTVVNGSPSAGAGARTQYVVGFTTSATGGLSAGANSRISVTFPAGTALGTFTNAQVFDITSNRSVGNCGAAVGQLIQCQLFTNEVIAAGDQVRITFNAITNPATPGPYTLDVSTTSDTTPVSSPAYNVVAANLLTGVTVVNGSPSAGAGARTQYVVGFTTSATGGCRRGRTAASR